MKETRRNTSPDRMAMPQELFGTVNLMAHPMAGAAAFGAIGLGFASQVFGLWLGAIEGAAEASRTMLTSLPEPDKKPEHEPAHKAAGLKLVASKPEPEVAPAARQPAGIDRPTAPDDLKAVSGIGPKLEKVLNGLGIWTWGQIAALDEPQIAWLDEQLGFSGRIVRDDWAGQARRLSGRA